MISVLRTAVAGGCVVVTLSGCRGEVASAPLVTLLDAPLTEFQSETRRIDFGTPEAHRHLLDGWDRDEAWKGGATMVWANRTESTLRFWSYSRGDLPLELHGLPFRRNDGSTQHLELRVNGEWIGEFDCGQHGFETRTFDVPSRFLRHGENLLQVRYAWTQSPNAQSASSDDSRQLAFAWNWLAFGSPESPSPTRPPGAGTEATIQIPLRSSLSFCFEDSPGELLRWRRVASTGSRSVLLHATLDWGSPSETRSASWSPEQASRVKEWRLAEEPGPACLSLAAVATSAEARGGLRLEGFEFVRAPRTPAAAASGFGQPVAPPSPTPDPEPHGSGRPNVLLYVIDTLRADHLGVYGYSRPVSPWIDAFAAGSVVFADAWAQGSWTRPSAASILTGLSPATHRVLSKGDRLGPRVVTLAERLRGAGYRTVGVSTNVNAGTAASLERGFDDWAQLEAPRQGLHPRARAVHREFLSQLDRLPAGRPFFAYLHTIDPHAPYDPPAEIRARFAPDATHGIHHAHDVTAALQRFPGWSREAARDELVDLYDGEIASNDAAFGELVRELDARDMLDDTLVIVTSDHGEEFLDHGGWNHGGTMFAELLQIPLIVRPPSGAAQPRRRDPRRAQHLDIAPTILRAAQVDVPQDLLGSDLLAPPRPDDADRELVAASYLESREIWSLRRRDLHYHRSNSIALFDLERDRGERINLLAGQAAVGAILDRRLVDFRRRHSGSTPPSRSPLDDEASKQLRALGYLR